MSDLEEFALDVLQRAKARSKVLKETLGRPDVAPAIETKEASSPIPSDENADISAERDDDDDESEEEEEIPIKTAGESSKKSIVAGPGSGVANVNQSDSPARRTRLKALAHTINNWDDDYSHHYTPQSSRFNLSKPPKSPHRKLPSSPSKLVAAPTTVPATTTTTTTIESSEMRVRLETKSVTVKSSVDTVDSRPLTVSQQIEQLCSSQLVVASVEKSFDECDASFSSSIAEETSIACCSEGETSKNSELSDSFTYFAPKPENGSDGTNVDNVPSDKDKAREKCVLDDSVIHALAAQGYVHSPASAKLYYEYKDKDQKDGKPQPYQLPGPKKTESPVKRAASPVRPVPVCTRSPSPTRPVPTVPDSGPRVVDLVRKQFEVSEKTNQDDKPKSLSTGARLDANTSRLSVAQKAAMYESMNASTVKEVDPTELSVAERMKLFEKKKSGPFGSSCVPRPPSPTRAGPTNVATRRPPRPSMVPAMPLKDRLRLFEQGVKEEESDDEEESDEPRNFRSKAGPTKPDVVPKGVPPPPPPPQMAPRTPSPKRAIPATSLAEAVRAASPKRQHPYNLQEIREADSSSDEDVTMVQSPARSSPKKEVSFCVPKSPGRINSSPTAKRSASPSTRRSMSPTAKRSMSPKANYPGSRDVKRIRVNEPKPGRMYPSLTDIETTETETDTDVDHADIRPVDADEEMDSETSIVSGVSSLGTYIERKAIENSPLRGNEVHRRYRPSEDFNASLACRQVDALIDEALEGQDYSMSIDIGNSSPVATSSPLKNNQRSPSPVGKLLNQNLVHTVSFYRRQQTLNVASPKVVLTPKRIPFVIHEEDPIEERTFSVEDKVNEIIKKLEVEAQAQQRSMAQASKALSLCKATMEFSDSRENVECERVLLIATQKHSALVNEIHRLKTEGILGRRSSTHSPSKGECAPSCKGNMAIHEIAVELKREFLSRASKGETVYHFMALVKYRNQLEASSLLSLGSGVNSSHLHAGVLHFPNSFCVTNLEPDFKVTMEVFVLETLREYLPHEAKYHIKKLDKNKLTPKKTKGDSHSKFTHFQHSPAGPDAIQACKFKSVGNLCIDISTLHRNHWQFERLAATGPLEGSVAMRIQCSAEGGVEERGFLTMFTDISGFGDWHRRWCKLTSTEMSYWMYPEDEPHQEPLGRIVLRHCVTSRVGAVPRDVCARANTFLLVTTRPPVSGDKDTLVTSCHGDYTAVRHLISADTREERDLWCKQFNRALANLRAWDPHAHSPDDTLF